jgi:hypothetical protein
MVGLATRLSLAITAPLYLFWFATYHSYGWVWHFKVVPVVALFVLLVSPAGRAYSVDVLIARRRGRRETTADDDEIAGWAIQFLIVVLATLYFFSAVQKLRLAGPDWFTAGAFEEAIALLGSPAARDLAEHHIWLIDGMALSVFAFELCAPMLLFPSRLRWWYASGAICFHVVALALLGLSFLGWAVVCTVVFPLERIPQALKTRASGAVRRFPRGKPRTV